MKKHLKLVLVFLVAFTLGNLGIITVSAHAGFVRSNPSANSTFPSGHAPTRVQVWFNEELEPKFIGLVVLNQQPMQVDNGDCQVLFDEPNSMSLTLPPNLPDGRYSVVYRTTSSEDGHILKTSFVLLVGVSDLAGGSPTIEQYNAIGAEQNFNLWRVSLRWPNYLSGAALLGGASWWLLIWQPALRKVKTQLGPE